MPVLRNSHADLHIPRSLDFRDISLPVCRVPSVLLRLLINAHTHIDRNRQIFRHHISIPTTHEDLHVSLYSAVDLGDCILTHVPVRLLHDCR